MASSLLYLLLRFCAYQLLVRQVAGDDKYWHH
jgi:hypothetical protein